MISTINKNLKISVLLPGFFFVAQLLQFTYVNRNADYFLSYQTERFQIKITVQQYIRVILCRTRKKTT